MKKKALLIGIIGLLVTTGFVYAASPVLKTMQAGGFDREYLVYTPQNPQQVKPNGIVVCLHGFNRTMYDFFEDYDISAVADSLNLIIVAPQALPEQDSSVQAAADLLNSYTNTPISLTSVWGCGLGVQATAFGTTLLKVTLNKDLDDVDFIDQLIDETLSEYSLPPENVFMLGTSMGGYMTYQYALEKGDRLSGLISISGSMGLDIQGMDYSTKVPVCDFHSITDEVVPYTGSMVISGVTVALGQNMQDVINYWVKANEAATTPVVEQVQNYPSTNGITVEKNTYSDPVNEVIHYKMNGSTHSYFFKKENGDCMDYAEEIAHFIQAHLTDSSTGIPDITAQRAFFYPNPVKDNIYLGATSGRISIYDLTGRAVVSQSFATGQANLSSLQSGIYVIRIQSGNTVQVNKLIKQ